MKGWKSQASNPYNLPMPTQEPLFRKPGVTHLRQAVDWVAFAGTWSIFFNVLHPSGIELKVHPSYEKAPSVQTASTLPSGSTSKTYSGWTTQPDKKKPGKGHVAPVAFSPLPSTLAEWQAKFPHLSILGAKAAWDDKKTVFLDARKPEDYAEGHVAGAVNFYAEEFDELAPRLLPGLDVHKTYVIYCNGTTCDLSHHLAERLSEQGFQTVKVFFNGWSEWTKAGFPVTKGATP